MIATLGGVTAFIRGYFIRIAKGFAEKMFMDEILQQIFFIKNR
jgi:hypothetical protein